MKLTKEQSDLVSENHNLIYSFIHKYHLDVEEWYDIIAIVLCVSACSYDNKIGTFSTYFYKNAFNKMATTHKLNNASKRTATLVELLENIGQHAEWNPSSNDGISIDFISYMDTINNMPPLNKRIAELRIDGYKIREIATMVGESTTKVDLILREIRKELKK